MMQKGLKIFGGFLIVVLILLVILSFSIDGIMKTAIEENGSELFQTDVQVGSLDISLFNGVSEISNFSVSNPDPFSEQPAIEMDQIRLKLDLKTILSDTILVESIRISDVRVYFEQRGFGINLRVLNQNMDLSEEEDEAGIVIDHLIVENARVLVSSNMDRERTAEAKLENFEIEGIGRDGSQTVKQSLQQILEPLITRAIQEAMKGNLLQQLENRVQDLLGGDEN